MQQINYSGYYVRRRFRGCAGAPRFQVLTKYGFGDDRFSAGDLRDAAEKIFNRHGYGYEGSIRPAATLKMHGKRALLRFAGRDTVFYLRRLD